MAVSSPEPPTRHRRRVFLPGRALCGPWRHQPPEPPSKKPIIIEGITGTGAVIGIDTIIGAPITTAGTDGNVGTDGTDGTGIIIGIHIIGSKLGRRSNLKTYRERKAAAAGPAFLSHGFISPRNF